MSAYQGLASELQKGLADLVRAARGARYSMIHIPPNLFRLDGATGEIEVFPIEDFFEEVEEVEEEEEPNA